MLFWPVVAELSPHASTEWTTAMPAASSRRFPRPSALRAALSPQAVRLTQKLQRLAARSLAYPEYVIAIERILDEFLARIAADDRTRKLQRRKLTRAVHAGLALAVSLVV
jgi:hypothetical protein